MAIIKLGAGHKYKFTSSGSNLQFKEGTDNPLGLTIASGGLQSHGNLEIISGSAIFDGPISASNAVRFTGLGGTYPSAGNVKTVYVQEDGTMQLGVIGSGTVDSSSGNIYTSDGNLVSSREIGLVNSNVSFMPGAFNTGTPTLFIGGDATYDNRIGINTATPTDALHVVGTISASTDIYAGGDIFCEGIITADEFHTTIVSTSVQYSTGNSEFGDESSDVHKFTGSLHVSGNLTVTDDDSLFYGMVSMSALSSSLGIVAGGGITAHGDISSSVDSTGSFGAGEFFGRVQISDKLFIGDSNTGGAGYIVQVSESGANALINLGTDDANKIAGITFTTMRTTGDANANSRLFKSGSDTYFDHDESYISRHNGKTAFRITGGGDVSFISGSSQGVLETAYLFGDASERRIGIGTTTPGRKLTVAGSDNLIFLDSTGNSYLTIDRSATDRRLALVLSTAGDGTSAIPNNINWAVGVADSDEVGDGTGFFIGTNTNATSANLFIEQAGNVGIGTTSPGEKLEVIGNVSASGVGSFESVGIGTAPFGGDYSLTVSGALAITGSHASHSAIGDSSGQAPGGGKFQKVLTLGSENDNGAVYEIHHHGGTMVQSIHTNRFAAQYHWARGSVDDGYQKMVSMYGHDNTQYTAFYDGITSTVKNLISSTGSNSTYFNYGNVGIGDTTPNAKLVVNSGDTNTVAIFKSTDDKAFINIADDTDSFSLIVKDAKFHIGTGSADYENFTVWPAQSRVGINTTAPNEALEVIGDISASGDLHGTDLHLDSVDQTSEDWYSLPNNEVQWDRTEAGNGSDEYVKIMTLTGNMKKIRLIVIASGNNTQAREEFLIAHSGYNMNTNIMQLPSTKYNASKVLGVYTNNPSASNQEVYIKVAGISSTPVNSGYVKIISNCAIHTAAEIQASTSPTFIPETIGSYSAIELSSTTHNNTSMQLSRGINAQGTSSMADLHVTENLGVGTTNPQSLVTIEGTNGVVSAGTAEATYKGYLQINGNGGTATQGGGIEFKSADSGNGYGFRIANPDLGNGETPLYFQRRSNNAAWTDAMTILGTTGNVGIGTTTPGAKLHVDGIISTSNDIVIESGDPTIHFKDTDGAYQGHVGVANTLMELRTDQNDVDIEIRTNQFDNAIYIDDSTQKIGIGTATPDSTLTVHGDISASGVIFAARFESSGSDTKIDFVDDVIVTGNHTVTGSLSALRVTSSLDGMHISGTLSIINENGPTAYIKTKVGSFDEYHLRNDQDAFQIYNATDDRKELVADGLGGIGIGVATPHTNGFALQVSGAIGVLGDNEHALGTKAARLSDVFAVQTTVGAIFETGLTTEGIGELKTGTVVVWQNGKLIESYKAEDGMVMGVIKQGKDEPIILGAEPLLVTGKVMEGDFLTTSDKLGHAKAQPAGYLLKMGTVIAQALESAEGESNLIKGMIRKL